MADDAITRTTPLLARQADDAITPLSEKALRVVERAALKKDTEAARQIEFDGMAMDRDELIDIFIATRQLERRLAASVASERKDLREARERLDDVAYAIERLENAG